MRLLPPEHARRVPWKNGRGSTLELATDAAGPGEPWTWRLSIADVPARAPFSAFPGVDRWLVCVDGPGLRLLRGSEWQPVPRSGHGVAFCGEEVIEGDPMGPGVRDGNLFALRSTWKGHLRLLHGLRDARPPTAAGDVVLLHALAGHATATEGDAPAEHVAMGTTAIAHGTLDIRLEAETVVLLAELRRR